MIEQIAIMWYFTTRAFLVILIAIFLPVGFVIIKQVIALLVVLLLKFFKMQVSQMSVLHFLNNIFFLGEYMKRMIMMVGAYFMGLDHVSGIPMSTTKQYWNIYNMNTVKQSIVVNYSPYLLEIFGVLLAVNVKNIANFAYYIGINDALTTLIVWYISLSIFFTGYPELYNTMSPVLQLVMNHPSLFYMPMLILIFSFPFYDNLGNAKFASFMILQFAVLLLVELQMRRLRQIVANPFDNPDDFVMLLDIGLLE